MQLVFSLPGQPRGRGKIERFFHTVNQMLLPGLDGYTPRGCAPPEAPQLTRAELTQAFDTFLHGYHQRPHQETGQLPQARWARNGFTPRLPESLETLDLLLLTVAKSRRVRQDGIHFQSLRYIDLTLAAYVGEDVVIRYDPRDMAEIRVYHGNRFLCRALCPELAAETISLKDIIAARTKRRKELSQTLSERTSLVEALLRPSTQAPTIRPSPPTDSDSEKPPPKLKRYWNE